MSPVVIVSTQTREQPGDVHTHRRAIVRDPRPIREARERKIRLGREVHQQDEPPLDLKRETVVANHIHLASGQGRQHHIATHTIKNQRIRIVMRNSLHR